jgi:N-glycosylase/DNA lyase
VEVGEEGTDRTRVVGCMPATTMAAAELVVRALASYSSAATGRDWWSAETEHCSEHCSAVVAVEVFLLQAAMEAAAPGFGSDCISHPR